MTLSTFEFHGESEHVREETLLAAVYRFRLGALQPLIMVRVWQTKASYGGDHFMSEQSHHIHTPTQATPYTTSAPFGKTAEDALRKAVTGFVTFYSSAVKEGHQPKDSWLVPNRNF